jgi:hypothetical protein
LRFGDENRVPKYVPRSSELHRTPPLETTRNAPKSAKTGSLIGFGRRLVAELWLYPDYSAVLELSTKCAPGDAFQIAAETRAFLMQQGIDLGGEQQAKTRKALEFSSDRLRGKGD